MLFGWRKRNEGFEWREYVRTTILVRRADRQKRLDDARLAALAKVKDAKDRGLNAGAAKVEAVRDGAAAVGQRAGEAVAQAALAGAAKAADGVKLAAGAVARAAGAIPTPSAPPLLRRSVGDVAMYAADIPRRWRILKPYLLPAVGVAAAVFVFGSALSPQMQGSTSTAAATAGGARSSNVTTGSITNANADALSGRGTVLSGDRLRVGGREVKLVGIEAPHPSQTCLKENGRRWECASSARSALRKLVRGKTVSCELKDPTAPGVPVAHCRSGSDDLAAQMVRNGHAFASADGLYASEEEVARKEKSGIWQGTADRPQDWRTKLWDEAKRSAPGGCPIKGVIRGEGRIYAMPWSDGYASHTLRSVKGERWFCSEDEARAAGYTEASKL